MTMTAEEWTRWAWRTMRIILRPPDARLLAESDADPDDPESMHRPLRPKTRDDDGQR